MNKDLTFSKNPDNDKYIALDIEKSDIHPNFELVYQIRYFKSDNPQSHIEEIENLLIDFNNQQKIADYLNSKLDGNKHGIMYFYSYTHSFYLSNDEITMRISNHDVISDTEQWDHYYIIRDWDFQSIKRIIDVALEILKT